MYPKGGLYSVSFIFHYPDPCSSLCSSPSSVPHTRNPDTRNPGLRLREGEAAASDGNDGAVGGSRGRSSDVQNKHQSAKTLTRRDRKGGDERCWPATALQEADGSIVREWVSDGWPRFSSSEGREGRSRSGSKEPETLALTWPNEPIYPYLRVR